MYHLILPAYNEAQSLPHLLKRLAAMRSTLDLPMIVWVIDDGSSDATGAIAQKIWSGLKIRLISHANNLGLGQALMSGILAVIEVDSEDDMVVVMDADDTHDVALIPSMGRAIRSGADIVIASRFVPGGDHSTAPLYRRVLSRGAAYIFRIVLPLGDIKDFTGGYRAYRAGLVQRAVRHWGERLVVERGFACMVELLLKLRHWNPTIRELPFVLRYDRKQGRSKLKLKRTIVQYLKLVLRDRISPAPLRQTRKWIRKSSS